MVSQPARSSELFESFSFFSFSHQLQGHTVNPLDGDTWDKDILNVETTQWRSNHSILTAVLLLSKEKSTSGFFMLSVAVVTDVTEKKYCTGAVRVGQHSHWHFTRQCHACDQRSTQSFAKRIMHDSKDSDGMQQSKKWASNWTAADINRKTHASWAVPVHCNFLHEKDSQTNCCRTAGRSACPVSSWAK